MSADKDGEWRLSCVTKPYTLPSASETASPQDSSFRVKRRRVQKTPSAADDIAEFDFERSKASSLDARRNRALTMDKNHRGRKSSLRQGKETIDLESTDRRNINNVSTSKPSNDNSKILGREDASLEPNITNNPSQKKSLRLIFSRNPLDGRTTLRAERNTLVDIGSDDGPALSSPTPISSSGRERRNASKMKRKTADDSSVTMDTYQTPTSLKEDGQDSSRVRRSSYREASRRKTLESYFPTKSRIQKTTPQRKGNVTPSKAHSSRGHTDTKLRLRFRQAPALHDSDSKDRVNSGESQKSGYKIRLRGAGKDNEESNQSPDGHMHNASSISPGSPMATRTSSRVRKPTAKAIEALEQKPKSRKTPGSSDKPQLSVGKEAMQDATRHKPYATENNSPNLVELDTLQESAITEEDLLAKQLYELAAAAIAPDFKLSPDESARIKRLHEEYHANQHQTFHEGLSRNNFDGSERASATAQTEPSLGTRSLGPKLDHSNVSRPWTDKDGWIHTGQVNAYGEEIALVPETYAWIETTNTHGDKELPKPPPQIKSLEQIEKDRIFGFPPPMGQRNLPQGDGQSFSTENVSLETAKIRARETAKNMGLTVDRSMSLAELEANIHSHDTSNQGKKRKRAGMTESATTQRTPQRVTGASRKRRRTEGPNGGESLGESLTISSLSENTTDKIAAKKRRVSAPARAGKIQQPPSIDLEEQKNIVDSSYGQDSPKPNETEISNETGPGGRPRRRAAAAMLAQIQSNAKTRARRASDRRKGSETPSKTREDSKPSLRGGEGEANGHSVLATGFSGSS